MAVWETCDHVDRNGSAYARGCRSQRCTREHRRRLAQRKAERRALRVPDANGRLVLPPMKNGPVHGGVSTYVNWGCRCRPCTDANSAWSRAYYSRMGKR